MRIIADLHIHSKYSRACSKNLDLEHINQWAKWKGIKIVGTGDFTHPVWLKELKSKLVEDRPGLFKLKDDPDSIWFMLSAELSSIYSHDGKTRRVHTCLLAPDFTSVDKIIFELEKRKVNLKSDGRPIMGISAKDLAGMIFGINPKIMVIPAHAWTPWFSVFGSFSGFNSLQECFGEAAKNIFCIETGLSSDPPMNWRLSALDKITLISNSDAHSPANLGREANVFEIDEDKLSYQEIYRILKEKDKKSFLYTIEFFPEEGKYHWDGHAACHIQFSPEETKKNHGICPVCKKPLTVGVLNRVDQLADRPDGYKLDTILYKSLVPLAEIISDTVGVGKGSKKVAALYESLIKAGGSEFAVLLDKSQKELELITLPEIAAAIINVRSGQVEISAGYDGVYGIVKVINELKVKKTAQKKLL
ncbi:MAG: endonuclease Q family protein [Candidatus Buchananbacteria bacterium]